MKIKGQELEVDVLEEIEGFDWQKFKKSGDEFQACSPFRTERRPSFFINIDTGQWIDHGADSDTWKKGNLITLLSFINNTTYEEAEDYLLEKYGAVIEDVEGMELNINIQLGEQPPKIFTKEELKPYLRRTNKMINYVYSRGITYEVMRKFILGADVESNAVAFFWLDAFTGKCVNVKFRSTRGKQFFYIRGGQPVSKHIYGLYQVIKAGCKTVWIVESEIDALYLWSHGIPAVALGGSSLSPEQKRKLLLAGVETYVIATDKDKAGDRIKASLKKELGGHVLLEEIVFPDYASDVNEIKPEHIKRVTDTTVPATLSMSLT